MHDRIICVQKSKGGILDGILGEILDTVEFG